MTVKLFGKIAVQAELLKKNTQLTFATQTTVVTLIMAQEAGDKR
jgi:hypothetical protein